MKVMTPSAAWGGSKGNGSSHREQEDGEAALATLPTLCAGGMLPGADLQISLLSPGKVTSGNLGNSKAGEAGGESFLQYSRDHDRTFISTLMSGGISSPGGCAHPTLLLTLFMRFLTFPATKQQVGKLQLTARWGTGRTEP